MASKQEAKGSYENAEETEKPKVHYSGSKSMPLIIGNETCEKLGSLGTANNLLVYFTTVFNMKAITATTLVNSFNGTANLASLPGAILSDTYFGRYKTLGFASIASFVGMLVLTLTAAISNLHPPRCGDPEKSGEKCEGPTNWQMAILLGALGLMVIGAGGIRPCNLAFGADQFDPDTESGRKGIKRFFNLYYLSLTCSMMISVTVVAYVQTEKSWALGLAIPAILMLLSVVIFFTGSRIYVKVKPEGAPLVSVVRVLVAAVKKRRLKRPENPSLSLFSHVEETPINSRLVYTDQFRFLDKAAIIDPDHDTTNPDGSSADPWSLCTSQQVEEAKCLARVTPIWSSAIIYYIATNQQQSFVVLQALQSDRTLLGFHIPAASYTAAIMIGVAIMIPIYDLIISPNLRKLTRNETGPTLLHKMAYGMCLSALTMAVSGLVEDRRRTLAQRRGCSVSPMSGFWLLPQLTLLGFSEALTVVSHIGFYYDQLPEDMRSVSGSFLYVGFAISSYLSNVLISVVSRVTKHGSTKRNWITEDLNEGRLDLFYYLIGVLQVLNLGYFIVCAKWYRYKECR